jgi:hypothetical protein
MSEFKIFKMESNTGMATELAEIKAEIDNYFLNKSNIIAICNFNFSWNILLDTSSL